VKPDAGLSTGSVNIRNLSQKKVDLPVAKQFSSPGHTTDGKLVRVVEASLMMQNAVELSSAKLSNVQH